MITPGYAQITYDQQTTEVPREIAEDDDKLRAALVTVWPSISTATITRKTEKDALYVTCEKKAQKKGNTNDVVADLLKAPEKVNPATALAAELKAEERAGNLTPAALLRYGRRIVHALNEGKRHSDNISAVLSNLKELPARPSLQFPDEV